MNDDKIEKLVEKELMKLDDEKYVSIMEEIYIEEMVFDDYDWSEEDIQLYRYEMTHAEEKNDEREEEILIEQYESETGKNAITSRKRLSKKYIEWKSTIGENIIGTTKKEYLKLDINKQFSFKTTKTFKINKYINLKLETIEPEPEPSNTFININIDEFFFRRSKNLFYTNIYIDDLLFRQCKYLLLDIPKDEIEEFDDITSVDDIAKRLNHDLERKPYEYDIIPEQEFQAHCSNIQAWVDYDYDTRILHSNLSFPLLKRLTKVGDIKAKQVFKEEIAKRYVEGNEQIRTFLDIDGYLNFLNKEEIDTIFSIIKEKEEIMIECNKKKKEI